MAGREASRPASGTLALVESIGDPTLTVALSLFSSCVAAAPIGDQHGEQGGGEVFAEWLRTVVACSRRCSLIASTACLIGGFRPRWRVNPPPGEWRTGLAAVRSASCQRHRQLHTHTGRRVNFDLGGDQHADMVPVCRTRTARFTEYQRDWAPTLGDR